MRWAWLFGVALLGCTAQPPEMAAVPWPEASALFLNDANWIGGDGAYSVDLGNARVLWLFGDSSIATSAQRSRTESAFIRNSVALQTGYNSAHAFMQFYYGQHEGRPSSFLPEDGAYWFWPGHGIRLPERLLLFYGRVYQESEGMWGFSNGESTAFSVDNPDQEPSAWHFQELQLPEAARSVQLGETALRIDDFLYVYGAQGSFHDVYLARFPLAQARAGDLSSPEWWGAHGFGDAAQREAIITPGAPEFSVNFSAELGKYVFVASEGFGATTIAVRTAEHPEGPWTEPRDVLRPPESFNQDAFVYAAKAHPEQEGADLAATYVPSGMNGVPPDPEEQLYYPRFVRIGYQ